MPERIRYALGQSSLGDFIAAASDRGLVAFEFGDSRTDLVEALHARFAGSLIEEDDAGMSDIVARLAVVVDHPDRDPGLPLDVRGSDFQKRVWDLLREIPAGRTTTYGAIAAGVGTPRDARDVTEAIAANTIAILIPCHRVVKKGGSMSGYRWGFRRKRTLLAREAEGAPFLLR
jgi:AraC family transcriptional regulator of adaptative response/methylated-DNA-[protein]-cysteine methyltransferase